MIYKNTKAVVIQRHNIRFIRAKAPVTLTNDLYLCISYFKDIVAEEFLTIIINDIVFVIGQRIYITIIMKLDDKIFEFINNISIG